MLTQLNYAFANISSEGKIALGNPEVDVQKSLSGDKAGEPYEGNFYQLTKLKQKNPNLKTVIPSILLSASKDSHAFDNNKIITSNLILI